MVYLDVMDDYDVSARIGQGNFASVNTCMRKTQDETVYALKTIGKEKIGESSSNKVSIV